MPATRGRGTHLMKEAPGAHAYVLYATGMRSPRSRAEAVGSDETFAPSGLPAGAWTHVAVTFDGSALRIYVDGRSSPPGQVLRRRPVSTNPLRIGGDAVWSDEFFDGSLDEIRVYDRALTAGQITSDMNTRISAHPVDTSRAVGRDHRAGERARSAARPRSARTPATTRASRASGSCSTGTTSAAPDTGAPYATTGTRPPRPTARTSSPRSRATPPATRRRRTEVSVTVANSSPSNNPVLALGFEEGSGTTTADASGTGNHGTVQGATWTTGKFGSGLSFNGSTNYVQVPDAASLEMTRDITLELWAKPRTLGNWKALLMKEKAPDDYSYSMYATNSIGLPGGYAGTGNLPAPTKLATNAWSHIAFTNDATASKLYVNGSLAATGPPQTIPVSNGALKIGGDAIWPGEFFDGVIDEVRVYNKALTAAQVTSDMNTAIVNTPPPPDTTNPSVALTAPANGATVSGAAVPLTATASDNVGVQSVQFRVNGSDLGAADTTSPYATTWDTTGLANGNYTLSAVARDAAGNTATSSVVVTVSNAAPDTTPPNVSMTAPANGATVSGTSVAVAASASDNVGVQSVQFKLDGNDLGAADTTSPYGVTWNSTTATNGTHALTAVAKDAAGNTKTATSVSVTVNNVPTGAAPVLALGFNETSGTTASDSSPSGNDGTLSGPVWATGASSAARCPSTASTTGSPWPTRTRST